MQNRQIASPEGNEEDSPEKKNRCPGYNIKLHWMLSLSI